ncbi:MAG TPA: aminotransferase class V-fold PLP-dependent enzyme [Gaiellaceae bacterium]|nr:aminotransferase class V-fold PLP-dependent enzyme [Gaiellaceae bacterium]
MTFAEARAAYPVLRRAAYLNAGTFGPLARTTLDAITARQRRDGEEGRTGKAYFEEMLALRAAVRERLAATVGVPPERVALASSTTEAVNLVLNGLSLRPDDEVVTTDTEHFGLIGGLVASGARIRVARVRDLPTAAAGEAILDEVGPRTRLLALSHVSWITGNLLPVHEVKDATRLPLLVDGAQAGGAIRVDASFADFYTVSAQKWLCGPDATGALVVADPDALRLTAPTYFSQVAYDLEAPSFEPQPGAARFDSGWIPVPSLAGLAAALDVHPAWAHERAAATAARCRDLLAERFDVVTEPEQATLVSFRSREDAAEVAAQLAARGVVIRDLPGTGLLRVSCGYWTSDEDLERLLAALEP